MRRWRRDRLRPDEVEAAIAYLPIERSYFFDGDGRQIAVFEGEESWVFYTLTDRERRRAKDGLLIHNHPPRTQFSPSDPRYDSASFSLADWQSAADLDLSALILVSLSWRHRLTRPSSGWYAIIRSEAQFEDALLGEYEYIEATDRERVLQGVVSVALAQARRSHRFNRRFARQIGASYHRERR